MSYRHPRFYREDFTGFNNAMQKSFGEQFKNVTDYFDKKIEARKEYEADLHAQADKMREEAEAAGNIGADFQKELEENIQNFLKEGLKMEATGKKGGIGLFGTNVKEFKKSQLDLDKANANFNAQITAANGITDRAFIQDLQIDEDYDHGSGSYLEYATVIKALKSNFREGGNIGFEYKGDNDFSMGVTINNPRFDPELPEGPDNKKMKTYSAQEIQRLIGENDPEARKQIEENIKAAEESLLNQAKSDLEKRNAYGQSVKGTEGNMGGKAYYGETDVEERVNQFVTELQQQDENNPDDGSVIDDIFNNKVKFNDNIRLEELNKVTVIDENGNTVKAPGTAILMEKIKDTELADELAMLLDLPKNDISYQKKMLTKMGITDPEDIKKVRSSLDEAKNNMVKRYLKNSVVGAGIGSKFVSPTQPKGDGSRTGSGANQDAKLYSQKKFGEAARALGGTAVIGIEDPDFIGPKVATLANTNKNYYDTAEAEKNEIESIFKNMEINTKDGVREADGVNFDPLTKKLTFDFTSKRNIETGKDKDGNPIYEDLGDATNEFDMSDPEQFEKLYLTMGIKATGQKGMSYETDYSRMASIYGKQNFFTHLYDQGRQVEENTLGDGNMSKWVTKTIKEDPKFVFDSLESLTPAQYEDIKGKLIILPGTVKPITIENFLEQANALAD